MTDRRRWGRCVDRVWADRNLILLENNRKRMGV